MASLAYLRDYIDHLRLRQKLILERGGIAKKLRMIFFELLSGRYLLYSSSAWSFLKDILFIKISSLAFLLKKCCRKWRGSNCNDETKGDFK